MENFEIIDKEKNQSKKSEDLTFYSFHDCERIPGESDYFVFKKNNFRDIKYPCLILIRDNGWNDYSYHTLFQTLYLPHEEKVISLGYVRIIQSKAIDLCTTLPPEFKSLPKKEFFSRGSLLFYNQLKALGKLKNIVLSALNDVYYHNYTKKYILSIDEGCLLRPYEDSLFRDKFYNSEVSSEYAKNSLDMLDKINDCVNFLSTLNDLNEQNISTLNEQKQEVIRRLLYGSVITSLESYLGDAFKYHVINNKSYLCSFLKNYEFPKGEKKYNLKELGIHGDKIGEFIENEVREVMNRIIFHQLEMVNKLYSDILNINLPSKWVDFQEAIQKRHDIFHRNGKNIIGDDLNIQPHEIYSLINQVREFIKEMELIINIQT